jgi:Fur family iron response transcriptional regulator
MLVDEQTNLMDRAEVEAILQQRSIYPTRQRVLIASLLLAQNQHITADGLQLQLQRQGLLVSKATVYNTLGLFVEKGLITELFIDARHVYYDSNNSHHHHFYNIDTGELTDISEDLEPRFNSTRLPEGTRLENVDIVIKIRNQAD